MQLKYHQATYDLITQDKIDPTDFIEEIEEDARAIISSFEEGSERQNAVIAEREYHKEKMLAWTKLDLYQRPMQFSQENIQKLDELEQKYDVKLPAAVREWYSLDIVPEIMALRAFFYYKIEDLKPDEEGNWHFLHWEYIGQGGETLFLRIDEGDNPPVYFAVEQVLRKTFSEFLHCHFWDWHTEGNYPYYISIQHHPFAPGPLNVAPRFYIPLEVFVSNFYQLPGHRFYTQNLRLYPRREYKLDENSMVTEVTNQITSGLFYSKSASDLREFIELVWSGTIPPLYHMHVVSRFPFDELEAQLSKILNELERKYILDTISKDNEWLDAASIVDMFFSIPHMLHEDTFNWLLTHPDIEQHPENSNENIATNRFRLK